MVEEVVCVFCSHLFIPAKIKGLEFSLFSGNFTEADLERILKNPAQGKPKTTTRRISKPKKVTRKIAQVKRTNRNKETRRTRKPRKKNDMGGIMLANIAIIMLTALFSTAIFSLISRVYGIEKNYPMAAGMIIAIIIIGSMASLALPTISAYIAQGKGRNAWLYWVLGVIPIFPAIMPAITALMPSFQIVVLVAILILPALKTCRHCAESIKKEARICPHCKNAP